MHIVVFATRDMLRHFVTIITHNLGSLILLLTQGRSSKQIASRRDRINSQDVTATSCEGSLNIITRDYQSM